MALRDEHADILGGPILQRPESGLFPTLSRHHFMFKSAILLGLGLLVWIVCVRGLEHLRKHRELRHRKAMRRKHGIPDSDCRPFAVAYAAAKRAHLEREAQDQKKMTNFVSDHNLPVVDQQTDARKDAHGLRRRVPETAVQSQFPGKHAAAYYDNRHSEGHSLDFIRRDDSDPRCRVIVPESLPLDKHPIHHASRNDFVINIDSNEESRKRSFKDENGVEHETMKKSRLDRDEHKGEGEQVEWYARHSNLTSQRACGESLVRQTANDIDDQERFRHINGFHDTDHESVDEPMEGIDVDEVTELKAVSRGKKRDRAEAGSSFGGDEDEDQNGRVPHHRKRRTVLQRRVEVPARGRKRDRGVEPLESDGEESSSEALQWHAQRSPKKRRGKKAASDDVNEIFVEDPHISKDPFCGGRRVGNEWEADGVQYKVGDRGQRLRLTLIKKARNKYHMPQDSQHPDRSAALEIYVETWMTDEQYKHAEERRELAWQETPREPNGSTTPDIVDSPTKNGKSLLWDSVKGSPVRRSLRQFVSTGPSTRVNPFEQLQPSLGRRVASSSATVSPVGIADSPKRLGFRGFSKWEKQDREADALARIRAKIEEQKKAQALSQKPAQIPSSVSAPELGTKMLSVPTITLTPAPAVAVEGHAKNMNNPLSNGTTATSLFTTSPSTNDSVKSAATITTGFLPPSTSTPAVVPSTLFPSVPIVPSAVSSASPLPSFSFSKSPQVPISTSTTPPSTVPNSFGKGIGSGLPSASASSPLTIGATNQSQPPSTESSSKPQSSTSFVKPDSNSFTSSAAVAAPPTTKSQMPNISASSPSRTIFTPMPTAKAEVPATLPIPTTSTAPENSKSTFPLFSFSGASSSTTTLQTPSAPKFTFGKPSGMSTFVAGPNLASEAASQPKPPFKFGQTPPNVKHGDSSPAILPLQKPAVPVSIPGGTSGSNEPPKPLLCETARTFENLPSNASSSFAANFSVAADSRTSTSAPLNPTLASANTTTANNVPPPTHAGTPVSGSIPTFTFGGVNSGSRSSEGLKLGPSFGGVMGDSASVPNLGGGFTEKKATFTFTPSAEAFKPISTFGGNAEGLKPPSVLGGSGGGSARSRGG